MKENDKYLIPYLRSCFSNKSDRIALKNISNAQVSYNELYSYCFDNNPFVSNTSDATSLIAIFGDKSPQYVKYIYAIVASGNAYLPLDFYSPPERLWFVIRDAGVKILLLEKSNSEPLLNYFKENGIEHSINNFDESYYCITYGNFKKYPSETAYVLYTSGSTGKPKGVIHSHKSAFTFINWFNTGLGIKQNSIFLSIAPFSFDVSLPDVFSSINLNGTLIIPQFNEVSNFRLLATQIHNYRVNCMYSTPSFFNALISFGKLEQYDFSNVSHVLFAGEQLYGKVVIQTKTAFKSACMYNLYGPTETNVVSYFEINTHEVKASEAIPIGKMCPYATSYLLPIKGDNELFVASESNMLGYIDKSDSFKLMEGKQYYDTGDLISINENGDFVFKCRRDKMIKRNGYRIEIGEIEQALHTFYRISDFAIKTEGEENLKIKVFYVSAETVSELELKNYFLRKLPSYMLPDNFIRVESIVKNANFKVDLNKL